MASKEWQLRQVAESVAFNSFHTVSAISLAMSFELIITVYFAANKFMINIFRCF